MIISKRISTWKNTAQKPKNLLAELRRLEATEESNIKLKMQSPLESKPYQKYVANLKSSSQKKTKSLKKLFVSKNTYNSAKNVPYKIAQLNLLRKVAIYVLKLGIIGIFSIAVLYAQSEKEQSAQALTENNVFWNYDALGYKMKGDINKAAENKLFSGRIAIVSLNVFEDELKISEKAYILNILENISYSSRLYYFVRDIEELGKTRINKDGKATNNTALPRESMMALGKKLDANYYAQITAIKKDRRIQLTLTIYTTETGDAVWNKSWSAVQDEERYFIQLNSSATIDNLYTLDLSVYVGQNILNIGHFGLEMGLIASFIDSNYPATGRMQLIAGGRIGGVIAFSLVQSIMDDYDTVDLFIQVRPGFNFGYVIARNFTPLPDDAGDLNTSLTLPVGFSLLVKNFFYIGLEVDLGHLFTGKSVPIGFVPVISLGFKF